MSKRRKIQIVLSFLVMCFTTQVYAQPSARGLIPNLTKSTVVISQACESSIPTYLSIGSYVKVAFISGEWLLEGHKDPQESSEINNVYGAGERLSVEDGPVCANGVWWWKVYSPMNSVESGWVPEASGLTRFLLKLTQNPADTTGTYDVFAPYGSGPWHVEAQTLMRFYASANNSTVVDYIIPGFAYEVVGRNESAGMFQVIVNGSVGWICGDGYYIAFDQRPHQVPVTDGSTYNCSWQDHYFDADEEMKSIADTTSAQYYAPGEYPQMQRFAEIVGKTVSGVGASADVVMSKASSFLSLLVNARFVTKTIATTGGASVGSAIEITCTMADLQNLGIPVGGDVGEFTPSQTLICIAVDTAGVTLEAGFFWGSVYGVTQLFLNSNTLNDFVDTLPLTHAYCKIVTCYGGPGVQ